MNPKEAITLEAEVENEGKQTVAVTAKEVARQKLIKELLPNCITRTYVVRWGRKWGKITVVIKGCQWKSKADQITVAKRWGWKRGKKNSCDQSSKCYFFDYCKRYDLCLWRFHGICTYLENFVKLAENFVYKYFGSSNVTNLSDVSLLFLHLYNFKRYFQN